MDRAAAAFNLGANKLSRKRSILELSRVLSGPANHNWLSLVDD